MEESLAAYINLAEKNRSSCRINNKRLQRARLMILFFFCIQINKGRSLTKGLVRLICKKMKMKTIKTQIRLNLKEASKKSEFVTRIA